MKTLLLSLSFIFLGLSAPAARAQNAKPLQCARQETAPCAQEALFTNKEFRDAVKNSLGKDVELDDLNVRVHSAGWASFGIDPNLEKYAKQNRLPESYFKVTAWYLIEVSKAPGFLKTFQVDLSFLPYGPNSTPADWKVATVEKARITETEPNKLEESIQKEIAGKLAKNGFVCESEELGLVLRADPLTPEQKSFGENLDLALKGKSEKTAAELGAYKLVISDFGGSKSTLLPPKVSEVEFKLALQLNYKEENQGEYQAEFTGLAGSLAFKRSLHGYANAESFCLQPKNSKNPICLAPLTDAVELSVQGKKLEKVRCNYSEQNKYTP